MGPAGESTAPFDSNEHYERLRLKLIFYFERRNCRCPEDLADDCLNRVFLDVKEHGLPTSLDKFCFGFASRIYLEWLRNSSRFTPVTPDMPDRKPPPPSAEQSRDLAKLSVGQLDPSDRELMEQYYLDRRTAESLATEWGLSPEGVRSRIFRKRRKLIQFFLANKESGGETKWLPPNIKK
jgi:RNA polymerase sigma factor (sigma-70 family)